MCAKVQTFSITKQKYRPNIYKKRLPQQILLQEIALISFFISKTRALQLFKLKIEEKFSFFPLFYVLLNISIKYKKSEGMHLYHFYSSLVS